jgi:hypothetical protein
MSKTVEEEINLTDITRNNSPPTLFSITKARREISRQLKTRVCADPQTTTMGHMHMIRKGIRSTDKPTINEIMNEELDPEPQLDPLRHSSNQQHYVGVTTIAFEDLKGIVATDLPGRFPTTSGQGNAYVMVLYDFDSNSINAVGIKNRKKESLVKGYNEMYEDLKKAGINPVLHRLDNEYQQT